MKDMKTLREALERLTRVADKSRFDKRLWFNAEETAVCLTGALDELEALRAREPFVAADLSELERLRDEHDGEYWPCGVCTCCEARKAIANARGGK